MILSPMFERFLDESPLSVMMRATLEHAFCASALDELFEAHAERGYTRELLFSSIVELMGLVVAGKAPHIQSAYRQVRQRIPVSLKSVYEKLQHVETPVCAAMVGHVAGRCGGLIHCLGAATKPL